MGTLAGIRRWAAEIVDETHPHTAAACAILTGPLFAVAGGPTAPLAAAVWLAVVWAELTLLVAVLQWLVAFTAATYARPLLADRRRARLRGVVAALFQR